MKKIIIVSFLSAIVVAMIMQLKFTGSLWSNKVKPEFWYKGNGYYWLTATGEFAYANDDCVCKCPMKK